MITRMFAFLDTKVGTFLQPFFVVHPQQALRIAIEVGTDPQTTLGRHPADFALCELGTFDDHSGSVASVPPINHGTVASLLPVSRPPSDPGDMFTIPSRSRDPVLPNGAAAEPV
jgi:hypothetical protein